MTSDSFVPKTWCNLLYDYPNLYREMQLDKNTIDVREKTKFFPKQNLSLLRQSHNLSEADITIPEVVYQQYLTYRPTPFRRAINFERMLGSKAKIFYKYEGANISGSHKLNSAIAQAYYYKQAGIQHLVTGTGAGQWGSALAYACKIFDLKCTIFMVDISYDQKPQRPNMMQLFGADVYRSPSTKTKIGMTQQQNYAAQPSSLAIATAEAIEYADTLKDAKFAVGSGETCVLLHQTIIGNEVLKQAENMDIFPDRVYACVGAGSNFCGISFPLMRYARTHHRSCEFIAVEPVDCPKLTKGKYTIAANDFSEGAPYSKMYTLGIDFVAPPIHAGGLRYHGTSDFLSILYHHKLISARAISQPASLAAGLLFGECEGVLPAPESAYALGALVEDLRQGLGENQNFLVNISGHGMFDMKCYQKSE